MPFTHWMNALGYNRCDGDHEGFASMAIGEVDCPKCLRIWGEIHPSEGVSYGR
jgi:hypothetical protein